MDNYCFQAIREDGEIICQDETFQQIKAAECLFFVKKIKVPRCKTYSWYEYVFVDNDENAYTPRYKDYSIISLKITGEAAIFQLVLRYKTPSGEEKEHIFLQDISYNTPREGCSPIKTEWSRNKEFKAIFEFFDSLDSIGEFATHRIIELARNLHRVEADARYEIHNLKASLKYENSFSSFVEEIIIPEGQVYIFDREISYRINLKRVFFPSTIKGIGQLPFLGCDKIEAVFCKSIMPPNISYSLNVYDETVSLYVPKESLDLYKSHELWGKIFKVIKGL